MGKGHNTQRAGYPPLLLYLLHFLLLFVLVPPLVCLVWVMRCPRQERITPPTPDDKRAGFTLIELSIVLVVIGLIVGGVLVGRELVRASEVRTVVREFQNYQTALNTFKLKYGALPGDLTSGASFFTVSGNGNGNGNIEFANELFWAWQELAQAGLIEGTYSGPQAGNPGIIGDNLPKSKINDTVGYSFMKLNGSVQYFSLTDYVITLGTTTSCGAVNCAYTYQAIFQSAFVRNVDLKMDDGIPNHGKILSRDWNTCLNSGGPGVFTYALNNTIQDCIIEFIY